MAVKVVSNIIQITAQGTVAGRPWASVWHMRNGGGTLEVAADPVEVVEDFRNNWQDHIMEPLSNVVTLSGFQWLSLNSAEGQTGFVPVDPNKRTTGGWQRDIAGPAMCYLVRKSAGSRRGARSGRAYLPGVAEEAVNNSGEIASAQITGINTNLAAFLSGLTDGNVGTETERRIVVTHFPPAARIKGPQVVQGTSSDVTSLTLDPRAATQRRRLR